jgi:RND family efflux transporter MFP subunit
MNSEGGDSTHEPVGPKAPPVVTPGRLKLAGLVAAVLAVIVVASGFVGRSADRSAVERWTGEQAVPTVALIQPSTAGVGGKISLPGRVEAYYRAPIYARVSGYLKAWYTDIGARVKAGQTLATIETPDLDQQLEEAKAQLATARANQDLAAITATRWQLMLKSDSVSKQAADERTGDLEAKRTITAAALANVQRLEALEGFKNIVAPFDGIVTSRNTDVGALINAGGGVGPQLFTVSDIHRLRVYVDVPQSETANIAAGMKAELTVPERPEQTFTATVDSTSGAVNAESGTLLVQLSLTEPSGAVLPGDFATVELDLPAAGNVVRVPSSALIFRGKDLEVATVTANDRVSMRPIVVQRDFGTFVEVASGLKPDDRVIDNPADALQDGDEVQVSPAAGAQEPRHAPG